MKHNATDKAKKWIQILFFSGLLAVTLIGVIKSWFISFDIDEAYAIAQSYRMAIGDHMFSEMWESHQMSAFLGAFLIKPYLWIAGGTTGIVLYLRIMGTLIHLTLGVWIYRIASRKISRGISLFIALLHLNFLPKWIVIPEFELMQYWAVLIVFCCAMSLKELPSGKFTGKRIWYLSFAGLAMFMALMTYPTMFLLYPIFAIGFYQVIPGSKKEKWSSVAIFTGACFLVGCVFLIYIFSAMSLAEFYHYVQCIFMDASHSENSLGVRFIYYGRELRTFVEYLVPKLLPIIIGVGVVCACSVRKAKERVSRIIGQGILLVVLLVLVCMIWDHAKGTLLEDKNQFYLYFRYLVAVIAGCVALGNIKAKKEYLWFGILPGFVGVFASILVTNMHMEIALARIYIAVIVTAFVLAEYLTENCRWKSIMKGVIYVAAIGFICSLFIGKVLQIRVTGCLPVTVKSDMALVEEGPAKGIYVLDEIAHRFNENTKILEEVLEEGDKLLYFGCENLYYLTGKAILSTPTTLSTTVFNEMFLTYYEEHPERIPNVIVIDKTFETELVYRYQEENQVVLDWIEKEYKDAQVREENYLIIIRK